MYHSIIVVWCAFRFTQDRGLVRAGLDVYIDESDSALLATPSHTPHFSRVPTCEQSAAPAPHCPQHDQRGYYVPTRLASSLCAADTGAAGAAVVARRAAAAAAAATADIAGGHIIVESNYKVNAWTTSRVQRSLLGLFCRCEASLPNFWVGSLTHDSVTQALASGISAEEIIAYLQVGRMS